MVDAGDSKSPEVHASCRFDSDLRHHSLPLCLKRRRSLPRICGILKWYSPIFILPLMTRPSPQFTGPVFVVGMVRSGTKLLRSLLKRHKSVEIPPLETDLLPMWVERWKSFGDLSERSSFRKFYNEVTSFPYFVIQSQTEDVIDVKRWYTDCRDYSVAGVFEALIRHDTNTPFDSDRIWGDKTPSYTRHVALLAGLYPHARFIHIVRDVRDYCLSVNKAWGKNMIRAAQRWSDDVQHARSAGKELGDARYFEIRYEDLIADPQTLLRDACGFLGIVYDESMTRLQKPSEQYGDARGMREVKRDNSGKYRTMMSPGTRSRVERIAGPVLRDVGYRVDYTGQARRVGVVEMKWYELIDAVAVVRNVIREVGLISAVKISVRSLAMRR